jgi:hypothetical protein
VFVMELEQSKQTTPKYASTQLASNRGKAGRRTRANDVAVEHRGTRLKTFCSHYRKSTKLEVLSAL